MNKSIKTEIVTITPAKAEAMLGKNVNNRNISNANLAALKLALIRGEWLLNGEAIKIAADGTILDGQHRLLACAETGIQIQTLIITGLPNGVQHTMDSGKSRTAADVLQLAGFTRSRALASTINAVIKVEQYGIKPAVLAASAYPVTRKQILNRAQSDPSMIDLTSEAIKMSKVGLTGSVASALMHAFANLDADDSHMFFSKLLNGDGMERGFPILTLRSQLLTIKNDVKGTRNPVYVAAITIKAWNKFQLGESASMFKFTPGGSQPEPFPEPILGGAGK